MEVLHGFTLFLLPNSPILHGLCRWQCLSSSAAQELSLLAASPTTWRSPAPRGPSDSLCATVTADSVHGQRWSVKRRAVPAEALSPWGCGGLEQRRIAIKVARVSQWQARQATTGKLIVAGETVCPGKSSARLDSVLVFRHFVCRHFYIRQEVHLLVIFAGWHDWGILKNLEESQQLTLGVGMCVCACVGVSMFATRRGIGCLYSCHSIM